MTDEHAARSGLGARRIVLPFLLLAVAVTIGAVLLKTPPEVPKSVPPRVAPVVGVAELKPHSARVFVEAFGEVVAAREVRIQPQVSGCIQELHSELLPGGLIQEGTVLFRIDPSDYEIAVGQAEADLEVSGLAVESLRAGAEALRSKARQVEAELEYLRWNAQRLAQLSDRDQAAEAEARDAHSRQASQEAALAALRAEVLEQEKSVARALAQVDAAKSRLAAAQLARARTEVQAPFDSIVLSEAVELGQLVGPQNVVATLAATDQFWVEASVPPERLKDIHFGHDGAQRSSVAVTMTTGDTVVAREGVVLRRLGDLDPRGRMARVLIAIRDPLALQPASGGGMDPILLGSYLRLAIDAGVLEDVYAIPRLALRENNRVWVRDAQGKLGIRPVRIVWRRQEDVLVRDGFAAGDQLVTTHLASVVPGMPLDVREPAAR